MAVWAKRTILFSTLDAALAARKEAAGAEAGSLLNARFTTPDAFVRDAWDVWGDARRVASAQERLVLVRSLLEGQDALVCSGGTAQLVARFVARCAGVTSFEEAVARSAEGESVADSERALAPAERAVLRFVASYERALDARGLVELGAAAAHLRDVLPRQRVSCVGAPDAAPAVKRLLASLGCAEFAADPKPFALPVPAGEVEAGLLVPAGATASAALIREEVVRFVEERRTCGKGASVVVCAPDPRALYEALAPSLAEAGVVCEVACRVPFAETSFGAAYECTQQLANNEDEWMRAATDFAHNPLTGMSRFAAQGINAVLRGNRLSTGVEARSLLRDASPAFALFETLAQGESRAMLDALDAIDVCVGNARLSGVAAESREHAAVDALRGVVQAAAGLGVGESACARVVRDLSSSLSVSLSARTAGENGGCTARFASPTAAASLAPRGVDLLVVADATDAAFPAVAGRSAFDALAAKLGVGDDASPLDDRRRLFASLQAAARERFTCVAPLRNAAQEEAYPSFVLEEYFDGLVRARKASGNADARTLDAVTLGNYAVPRFVAEQARRQGEEALVEGMGQTFCKAEGALSLDSAQRGRLRILDLCDFVSTVQENGRTLPVLSPSAIEAYLACPYRWFVERRLRLTELDEGFGALEFGSFAHEVLATFYDALAERGFTRVPSDPEGFSAAEAVFDEVFDQLLAAQPRRSKDRLVPATETERVDVARLRETLRACVARLARFAPAYDVLAHEVAIASEDGIDYAGARLVGRADRVDVDRAAKRFVVLDYKGSSAGRAAGLPEDADLEAYELPHKVQALMYAQALRSTIDGLACAGALYLGYRAKTDGAFAAGSYDAAFDAAGFAKGSSCVHMNFDRFLDLVEERVAPYLQRLMEGRIEPSPASKASCGFCPVENCERRLA